MLEAIILGIIQGLTEFFPVSSSGHLLLLPELSKALGLGLDFDFQDSAFDITLHIATFLAILIAYRKRLWTTFANYKKQENFDLIRSVFITTIPVAMFGAIFFILGDEVIKNESLATFMLIFVGILLIVAEIKFPVEINKQTTETTFDLKTQDAFTIGLGQSVAFVRGVSRSGITMLAGLMNGLNRREALDYAFLSGIPVFAMITAAQILQLITDPEATQATTEQIASGFIAALITGILVISIFRSLINKKGALAAFGIYRIILGIIIVIFILS